MSRYDAMTPKDCHVVVVEWEDITHFSAWNESEDDITTTTISTLGWLLEENDKHVVVASTYDHDSEQWADYHAFPKIPATVVVVREASQ